MYKCTYKAQRADVAAECVKWSVMSLENRRSKVSFADSIVLHAVNNVSFSLSWTDRALSHHSHTQTPDKTIRF